MRKRNERRNAIQAAFDRLSATAATARGAATNELARVEAENAKQEHALRIARHGVSAVARDPGEFEGSDRPEFRRALEEAVEERTEVFSEWTARGPSELAELVSDAAPGTASAPWREWLGSIGTADARIPAPTLWRFGTAHVPDAPEAAEFPAAVPLLDESHLRITCRSATLESATRDAAESLVQNLLLRMLSYYEPGLVRVHVWDIARLTGTLPGLFPLTRSGLLTAHDPTRLDDLLEELAEHIRRIHTTALLGGHTSLKSLAAETGHRGEPWRVAVLFGDGEPLRDEQQQQLQRVARNGLACGIQLIVVDLPMTVNNSLESVTLIAPDAARSSMTGPHLTIRPDEVPPRERVSRACSAISEAFQSRRARVRTFEDLLPGQLWTQDSTGGLTAPVGFFEGEPVRISLGDTSPHTLIGGPSGSGKTNFLYGMLGSLAARYSPDELEMYLLDFKEGVSFAQFTPGSRDPSWLPHARLVGVNVNTDREFGLALLRFLATEMRRRADAAKEQEVTKLEELRQRDPQGRWPRIVAVIDEFQYLFAERDAVSSQAATLLEDVARRGRSQGIHLVLASQDVSGIEAFWGKPAIFEQFILRVALPKARRVLVDNNTTALELPRWHAVVNHESGVKHGNEVVRVPDATASETFDSLQHRLWERHLWETGRRNARPPRLFDGSHLPGLTGTADFEELRPAAPRRPRVLLGQVIDVRGTAAALSFERSPGRNLAVLGSAQQDATAVLGAGAVSLGRQFSPGNAEFTVATLNEDTAEDAWAVAGTLREDGHTVTFIGPSELEDTLRELSESVDERGGAPAGGSETVPRYLLLYAVDAVQSMLERKDPESRTSGLDRLRKVLKQGPECGVHTIGWWRSAQRLRNTLGMGPTDDVGAWVAFDVQGQELSPLAAGQPITWSPRVHRGLFFDRSVHSHPEVVLPFDLTEAVGRFPEEPSLADADPGDLPRPRGSETVSPNTAGEETTDD
ncbi:cell division protein FtsK [Actinopolyspora erythraea]|uniref:Cell division protein FtsK n=1 Tax=Actinopolyspora erythraea TaxID=414996 RepID=A0A099D4T7_9ACTN|nr:FtsK/SpoIIIE domain-containing protein [Actinopolyspora erythraea]ASU77432.1 cell division protein FtsK [Actinopolyspora erythraea]KGI80355.1 cell division protein FtsK [Actinopolyspora erythraea]